MKLPHPVLFEPCSATLGGGRLCDDGGVTRFGLFVGNSPTIRSSNAMYGYWRVVSKEAPSFCIDSPSFWTLPFLFDLLFILMMTSFVRISQMMNLIPFFVLN